MLLVHATVSYFLEYGTNFVFLPLVSPVAFSITDIVRRVSTIGINAILFGKVRRIFHTRIQSCPTVIFSSRNI